MDLYGRGFSNIRFAGDDTNYIYSYSTRINTFSQEVFIHEFLHTLERISREHGYPTINLHDFENYGYDDGNINGLEDWYADYMRCEILDEKTGQYIGLKEIIYSYKPVNENNFKFAIEINFNNEPSNIIEEIKSLFNVVSEAI